MDRADGEPRTVLCFLDEEGYIANLECVYYDDAISEWPNPARCAVLIRDEQGYLETIALPSGATVKPHDSGDRWVSFEEQKGGGFCASTWSGYWECWAADGAEVSRVFAK